VSPLLANVSLHYVFDLWTHRWRQRRAHGDVVVVRFADDFVVGFQYRDDAEQFLAELRERFARVGLTLHPDKTRLIEFGRFAAERRRARGEGKPDSVHFLGFTHHCATTRQGSFTVLRRTMRVRLRAKLPALKLELRRRMHRPVPELGRYLRSVVVGTSGMTGCRFTARRSPRLSTERRVCGGELFVAAANAACRGRGCDGTATAGFRPCASATRIRLCGSASSPEVGAGCGNAARPDLWRG